MHASAQRLVDRASDSPQDFRCARAAGTAPLGAPGKLADRATVETAALAIRRQQSQPLHTAALSNHSEKLALKNCGVSFYAHSP